jgi:hypothetical protein
MTACVFNFIDVVHCGDDIRRLLPFLTASGVPRASQASLAAAWSLGPDGRLRRAWRVAGRTGVG